MQTEEIGDLMGIRLVRDGNSKLVRGNFIGLYGTPSQGGVEYYCNNGDCGEVSTEKEAIEIIANTWREECGE